ncbi:MAG TPA: hypothetical protein PKD83_11740 [Ignavibacteria bacterium]|mgnify:CR=1 FL=1|nr:hypothetical protein [Ignavibacteria bacterium]
MDIKELFDLQEKLESRINAYWTYWSLAVFAITGWLFSSKYSFTLLQSTLISLGAAIFFICNLAVLWQSTKLVTAIRDEIRLMSKEKQFKSSMLMDFLIKDDLRFRLQITLVLHLAIDIFIIIILFNQTS